MIELFVASKLNDITPNNFPVKLPENTPKPALTYEVLNKRKHKHVQKSNHYTVNVQVNVYSTDYKQAKTLQQQVEQMFDEEIFYTTLNVVDYSIESYITNVVDLFSFDVNQIAINIQLEYIAHTL